MRDFLWSNQTQGGTATVRCRPFTHQAFWCVGGRFFCGKLPKKSPAGEKNIGKEVRYMIEHQENSRHIEKREWEGCIRIALDLLEDALGTGIHRGTDAIEERQLFVLGKAFKDAAFSQGNVTIEKGA